MEELSIYNLTITSDHRLKVNNEEISGDGSILPGDSESLLAWALVQVGYIQQDSDASNMVLQIEDERPGGYGSQKVTIPPGKSVLIEALRKQTGRDLSRITEDVQREQGTLQQDTAVSQDDTANAEQWGEQSEEASESPRTDYEGPAQAWADPLPSETGRDVQEEQHVLAPPPSLAGVPDTPAHVPEPPMRRPRGPERHHEEPQPETSPIQTVQEDSWLQDTQDTTEETGLFPDGWGEADDHEENAQPQEEDDGSTLPQLPSFAPEPEVTEHEDISTQQVTYKRRRPELGEGEATKVKDRKKPKKPRSKPMIAALVIVSLLAVFLAVQLVRSQGENSYVATCVDERTMVRQASDSGCKNEEAPYYRWWYTPSGSEVPAVNQTVAQDEGTRIRPEEATIREGFAPEGGPYGGDEEK